MPRRPRSKGGRGRREALRVEREEEEDFENALTDEQPWEVSHDSPDPRWPVPRGGVRGAEGSRGGEGRRRQGAGEGGGGSGEPGRGEGVRVGGCGRGLLQKCIVGCFL